jgi:hypothetical protein
MTLETTKLNNGVVVLASKDRYGYFGAATYMNSTQAQRKIDSLAQQGITAHIYQAPMSRVRYIVLD